MRDLNQLKKKLQLNFKDNQYLERAFVHRSFLNEANNANIHSNERLEFLGDAVLEFVISEWLFQKFPQYPEGQLTNFRSNVVRTTSLAEIAKNIGLGDYLLMSRGERESGGSQNPTLLANCLEAVIGAIFLDQGIKSVEEFIKKNFAGLIEKITQKGELKDTKSLLQEKLQAEKGETPIYKTLEEKGPDHDKIFTVGVFVQRKLLAKGMGKSKQLAEEAAAKEALEKSF